MTTLELQNGVLAFIGPGYTAGCEHRDCFDAAERGDLNHSDTCECPITRDCTHITIGYQVGAGTIDADTAINIRMGNDNLELLINELKDQWKRQRAYARMMARQQEREARE